MLAKRGFVNVVKDFNPLAMPLDLKFKLRIPPKRKGELGLNDGLSRLSGSKVNMPQ